MATEHTKEPWELHEGLDYVVVLRGDETTDQGIRVDNVADAHRIVACVNACAGLPTEELERIAIHAPFNSYAEMKQQRDELLAALEGLLNVLPSATTNPIIKAARTAIAKVRVA